jgi:5-methylcytosine-specific restriction enzyme B
MTREQLKQSFLDEWPTDRVANMTLEEYTNSNKTSFCYWLESKTPELGSIWGGSSYKFGVYKMQSTSINKNKGYSSDNEYAWVTKYGITAAEAFVTVKGIILTIVEAAQLDQLDKINKLDLGPAYRWKIAFLYSDYKIINIFRPEALQFAAESLGMTNANNSPSSALHSFIVSHKPANEDYYIFTSKLWQDYEASINNTSGNADTTGTNANGSSTTSKHVLNTILFGPPGTGKTYNTVNIALQIADPAYYDEHKENRTKLLERFNQLLISDWKNNQKGQIGFCTFHQSFSYEDFIEGIKPLKPTEDDTFLKYDIEDGIFKKIADQARYFASGSAQKDKALVKISESDYQKANFYKISLGDINIPEDQDIYDYCVENDYISIGFMGGYDLSGKTKDDLYKIAQDNSWSRYSAQAMSYFNLDLKIGDYIIVSKGNSKVRAIGKVTGDYFYDEQAPIRYNHFRKVKWLLKSTEIPIAEIFQKSLSQQTIYSLNKAWINKDFFVSHTSIPAPIEENRNYILIIDEINRGNVSQIFGELITLIEEDKRVGRDEALSITLPYSKETFSVPSNLHILGTMNTADRSVEALDTALRRRFSFIEMPPKSDKIKTHGKLKDLGAVVEGIDLADLLSTLNTRIEKLLDKNHLIGHSYFMKVANIEELQSVFNESIIPLLQEYFYGDFAKIGLIIGKGFFEEEKKSQQAGSKLFADFYHEAIDELSTRPILKLKKIFKMEKDEFKAAICTLLNKKSDNGVTT